jgi:hypothetical protein
MCIVLQICRIFSIFVNILLHIIKPYMKFSENPDQEKRTLNGYEIFYKYNQLKDNT